MNGSSRRLLWFLPFIFFLLLACKTITGLPDLQATPTEILLPTVPPTPLPVQPIKPGAANPDEPLLVRGDIPYTSPFFVQSLSEPFVLLEDEAGFVRRDKEFTFRKDGQAIGPVTIHPDQSLTYSLPLPAVPQGTYVDVDNDGESDTGLQVFAAAYWGNTWGDAFLEERDGRGWSTASTSAIVDSSNNDEIIGGKLIIWSPDDQQGFPTGFGADGLLFTADDPVESVPSGYSFVDLDQDPFRIYKEAEETFTLNEGVSAVNDYSADTYAGAFEKLYDKISRVYAFTDLKKIDWPALHDEFAPRFEEASDRQEFYRTLRDFASRIPDSHVNYTIDSEILFEESAGGFGLILAELSDGRILVKEVLPGLPGDEAGIQPGAELLTWDGQPVSQALEQVFPALGPKSSPHGLRQDQLGLLTHVPPGTRITARFRNPGSSQEQEKSMQAVVDYESLFRSLPYLQQIPLSIPVDASLLPDSGLGYIRVDSFSEDGRLTAHLWERAMQQLQDEKVPGLIIDLRSNSGGDGGIANAFAGYFFDEEFTLYRNAYFNEPQGKFIYNERPTRIFPGPLYFEGPVALLVSPDCASACEGFAYALANPGRAIVVGNAPSAGAFGEVSRGQFDLPEDISIQIPTGRSETLDGQNVLEGTGVVPDVLVPVTEESLLSGEDTVLQAAVAALQEKINQ